MDLKNFKKNLHLLSNGPFDNESSCSSALKVEQRLLRKVEWMKDGPHAQKHNTHPRPSAPTTMYVPMATKNKESITFDLRTYIGRWSRGHWINYLGGFEEIVIKLDFHWIWPYIIHMKPIFFINYKLKNNLKYIFYKKNSMIGTIKLVWFLLKIIWMMMMLNIYIYIYI